MRRQLRADALLLRTLAAWQLRDLWVAWRQWPGPKAVGRPRSAVPDGVGAQSAAAQGAGEAQYVDPAHPGWGSPSRKHRDSAWPALADPAQAHLGWLAGWMQPGPQWRMGSAGLEWPDAAPPATARALHSAPRRRERGWKRGSKLWDAREYRAWLPEAERLAEGVDAGLRPQLRPYAAEWP
jgi:hypothetical protein